MHLLEYPEIASFCPSPVWGGDSCVQTANRSYCEPGRPQRRLSKKSEVMRTRAGTETRPYTRPCVGAALCGRPGPHHLRLSRQPARRVGRP